MIKENNQNPDAKQSRSGESSQSQSPDQKELSSEGRDSSKSMQTPLHEIFLDEVADVHNAEQQLIKALPEMAEAAQSDELREAFESHLEETEEHVNRLKQAMSSIGESLKSKHC